MEAAHIIPFLLNGFDGKAITSPQIVRDVLSFLPLTHSVTERRCPDLGHASVLDASRLYGTRRIEYQLSYKCHLHDNDGAYRFRTIPVLSGQGRSESPFGGDSLLSADLGTKFF
jgi:hypothetical protein